MQPIDSIETYGYATSVKYMKDLVIEKEETKCIIIIKRCKTRKRSKW